MPVIRIRRGTTTQWGASTKILEFGELGLDTTLNKIKAGNGTSLWPALPFLSVIQSEITEIAQDAIDSIVGAITNSKKGYSAYHLWEPVYFTVRDLVQTIEQALDSAPQR